MSDGQLVWFKSSYSDDQGAACLEVAHQIPTIRVRDSKLGDRSPKLTVTSTAWTAFLAHVRS